MILTGEVVEAPVLDSTGEAATRPAVVQVLERFVGLDANPKQVHVWAGWLEKGEKYLVAGYRTKAGEVAIGMCSPTTKLSDASTADLRYLRRLSKRKPFATLDGFVSDPHDGLAGVVVWARSAQHEASTETGKDGSFSFEWLPPGDVHVTIAKEGYVPRERRERNVSLAHGSCAYLPFDLYPDGGVSGVVLRPDGSPAKGYEVQLIPSASGFIDRYVDQRATTDDQGRYAFIGVSPGEYLVGINVLSYDRDSPIPKTFFPGIADQFRSTAIILGHGQQYEAGSFWAPTEIAPERMVEIEAVWPDGAAVERGVIVAEAFSEEGEVVFSFNQEIDRDGKPTRFRAFHGVKQRFFVRVVQGEWAGKRCLVCMSKALEVGARETPARLRLVVNEARAPKNFFESQ